MTSFCAYLHHKSVRRMDKVRDVALRRALQAELPVRGHRVVHKDDGGGEAAVVQYLPVVLTQLAALSLEPELILEKMCDHLKHCYSSNW